MIALEHTLIILLLLVGLLNARPKLHWLAIAAIIAGLALAFITPAISIPLPWDWLAGLAIPLLLWQTGRRLVNARWLAQRSDVVVWLLIASGISAVLLLTWQLSIAGSIMLGLMAASMVWRAAEPEMKSGYLGQIGPLALAFLLAEIAPAVEAPNRYLLALLGGSGMGVIVAYSAVQLAKKQPDGLRKDLLSLGQVYLAYGAAIAFDLSGVAAATLSVVVYIAFGVQRGLWPDGSVRPRPLNNPVLFGLAIVVLGFFSWQTHVPLSYVLLLEVGLALLVTGIIIWAARLSKRSTFGSEFPLVPILVRVGLLLTPALLLWPRDILLDPWPLALALIAAGLMAYGTHIGLTPLLNLYSLLDEEIDEARRTDQPVQDYPVRNFMRRDYITIPSDLTIREIVSLFYENGEGCGLVVDDANCLAGIITEADLFVKEERLPRTEYTYLALFKKPIVPEVLPAQYAKVEVDYVAADVMTRNVIQVDENDSLGEAIRLMAHYGFRYLPVVKKERGSQGELVGLLTRADILRDLLIGFEKEGEAN